MKNVWLGCAVALLLQGCGNGSSGNDGSPLVGTRVTEECVQLSDRNGAPGSVWAKSEYTFSADGVITWRTFGFDDNSCTMGASLIGTSADIGMTLTFEDLGVETLQEGVSGHRLHLQGKEGNVAAMDEQEIFATFPNENRLCTSANLRLSGGSMGYSDMAGTQINYDACLVTGVLP